MTLHFYDEHFAFLMRLQPDTYPQEVCQFIRERTHLNSEASIFDQGCGIGRISQALTRLGFKVTGLDQNPHYIAEARQLEQEQPTANKTRFILGDARHYHEPESYDLVISWHTSFGHFSRDQDNQALLTAAFNLLKPGGQLLLDYANFHYVQANFQSCLKQTYLSPDGPLEVWRHSELEKPHAQTPVLKQIWEFRYPDGHIAQRPGNICAYTPEQLIHFLENAGFDYQTAYADHSGTPFDNQCPRWICHAQKPPLQGDKANHNAV